MALTEDQVKVLIQQAIAADRQQQREKHIRGLGNAPELATTDEETFSKWKEEYQNKVPYLGWDLKTQKIMIKNVMTGPAKATVATVDLSANDDDVDLATVLGRVEALFISAVGHVNATNRFESLTQGAGESTRAWASTCVKWFKKAEPNLTDAEVSTHHRLLKKIRSELHNRETVRMLNSAQPANVDQLVEMINRQEANEVSMESAKAHGRVSSMGTANGLFQMGAPTSWAAEIPPPNGPTLAAMGVPGPSRGSPSAGLTGHAPNGLLAALSQSSGPAVAPEFAAISPAEQQIVALSQHRALCAMLRNREPPRSSGCFICSGMDHGYRVCPQKTNLALVEAAIGKLGAFYDRSIRNSRGNSGRRGGRGGFSRGGWSSGNRPGNGRGRGRGSGRGTGNSRGGFKNLNSMGAVTGPPSDFM